MLEYLLSIIYYIWVLTDQQATQNIDDASETTRNGLIIGNSLLLDKI